MIEFKKTYEKQGNPCSICQRNILQCSWLRDHKEVSGWKAKKVSQKQYRKGHVSFQITYAIEACPLYIPPQKGRKVYAD